MRHSLEASNQALAGSQLPQNEGDPCSVSHQKPGKHDKDVCMFPSGERDRNNDSGRSA